MTATTAPGRTRGVCGSRSGLSGHGAVVAPQLSRRGDVAPAQLDDWIFPGLGGVGNVGRLDAEEGGDRLGAAQNIVGDALVVATWLSDDFGDSSDTACSFAGVHAELAPFEMDCQSTKYQNPILIFWIIPAREVLRDGARSSVAST